MTDLLFKNRPDQKGIKTEVQRQVEVEPECSKTDPIKRGSRPEVAGPVGVGADGFKNRPDQKGIKTLRG